MMSEPRTMSKATASRVDEMFRDRWRTLVSVDKMIAKIAQTLEGYGLMENTYFLLTSDNGYHLGQFAMPLDKRLPYEFDIRVGFEYQQPAGSCFTN